MSNTVVNAIMQKKIEGILKDLMFRTNVDNVMMPDGVTTLASRLAKYLTVEEVVEKIDERIDVLVDGAPEALDTFKEVAEAIKGNKDISDALNAAIGDKVSKETGKGLSANDFTDTLKAKLDSLVNYTHPLTHSADMITETNDKKFVTAAEKLRISQAGRILVGTEAPADMTENDLFFKITE